MVDAVGPESVNVIVLDEATSVVGGMKTLNEIGPFQVQLLEFELLNHDYRLNGFEPLHGHAGPLCKTYLRLEATVGDQVGCIKSR